MNSEWIIEEKRKVCMDIFTQISSKDLNVIQRLD